MKRSRKGGKSTLAQSKIKLGDKIYNTGKWSTEEDQRLLSALEVHGNKWGLVEGMVGTRNRMQIRSHCQKYFKKVLKQAVQKAREEELNRQQYGFLKRKIFVITQEYRRCATNTDIYNASKYILNPKQIKDSREESKPLATNVGSINLHKSEVIILRGSPIKYAHEINQLNKKLTSPLDYNEVNSVMVDEEQNGSDENVIISGFCSNFYYNSGDE